MPFDAVFYDFDGLIADTETTWFETWRDAFARHGGELALERYASCVGTVGMEPEADLAALAGEDAMPALLAAMDADAAQRSRELPPRPGIPELIEDADRLGIARAIVSSSPRSWVEDMLRALGLDGGWAALVCADGDRSVAKPAPDLYLSALSTIGVTADRSVAFEDSPNGVRAASRAGIPCVAIPNPITATLDLSGADLTLTTLAGVSLRGLRAQLDGLGEGGGPPASPGARV